MKKGLLVLFSLVALIGILNCVLIEPAFACKDEAMHSDQASDSDCCFIHCSMHHQWIPSSSSTPFRNVSFSAETISSSITFHLDAPPGAIFHPPLAL